MDLSIKIITLENDYDPNLTIGTEVIRADDVRQFIKELKDELDSDTFRRVFKSNIIHMKIDKLAGELLTDEELNKIPKA